MLMLLQTQEKNIQNYVTICNITIFPVKLSAYIAVKLLVMHMLDFIINRQTKWQEEINDPILQCTATPSNRTLMTELLNQASCCSCVQKTKKLKLLRSLASRVAAAQIAAVFMYISSAWFSVSSFSKLCSPESQTSCSDGAKFFPDK